VRIFEQAFSMPVAHAHRSLLSHLERALKFRVNEEVVPNRFVITKTSADHYECEVGFLEGLSLGQGRPDDIFKFSRRQTENANRFNAALLVPTGIGAEIGGHAGDAGPVARLLASACDFLVTHPNVVNASDINEVPENALYVEGSILTRLLMGTVGLMPVRSNRVIVVIDDHESDALRNAAINAVNAARATYGFKCPKIVLLDPPLVMRSEYKNSGRASGEIRGFDRLLQVLLEHRDSYDAVAVSSVIQVPSDFHHKYFDSSGEMVNPWGGIEALLTHAISSILGVPSAHSPMLESEVIANSDPGIVDPRLAAEATSVTFLQCILKGLQRSPRIVTEPKAMRGSGVMTVEDVSCLVIPDGCVGLPTLAALEQGIAVIAVRENTNLMRNNLRALPWAPDQLYMVENYWEAVGVMSSLRVGMAPHAVRRPIELVGVEEHRTILSTTRLRST
jgi:hypothetical protein